jgi:hypothetical protein|tara:strand:- start:149 stop:373 length:225 start_codon:yes stop_codon:yes gene_type:complete
MNTEFDWFMITMPIFALVVYFILMVGSMEKEPEFLRSAGTQKVLNFAFFGLFGAGILISCYYMIVRFIELLANY